MKKLVSIKKQADGFLKKYCLHYEGEDGDAYDWDMVSPREITKPSDLVHGPTAVEMIARFPDGDLLLQKEFRYPLNRFCYAFPCGMIDPGERVEDAVKRELYEETGVRLVSIDRMLPPAQFAAGLCDEIMQVVYVTVDGALCPHPDRMEEIVPMKVPVTQVRDLLQKEDLTITIACMLVLDEIARQTE